MPSFLGSLLAAALCAMTLSSSPVSAATSLSTLSSFSWTSCDTEYCGTLEFCLDEATKVYGYRNTGSPCEAGRGPVIRVIPGKTYNLTLKNTVEEGNDWHNANVYVHGLHISGTGSGNDYSIQVPGGECKQYKWAIPSNHMGGTFWYHSVIPGNIHTHLAYGAAGMLIVEDLPSQLPPDLNFQSFAENEILLMVTKTKNVMYGNGRAPEQLTIVADQWYRLRLAMLDPEGRPGEVSFDTDNPEATACIVHPVARDGVWFLSAQFPGARLMDSTAAVNALNEPVLWHGYYMAPGASRADFAIKCPASVSGPDGPIPRKITVIFHLIPGLVMELSVVQGQVTTANPMPNAPWPARPPYLSDLTTVTPTRSFEIKMRAVGIDVWPTTGQKNNAFPNGASPFSVGDVVEILVSNNARHPFHLQGYPFQTVAQCGDDFPAGWWFQTLASTAGDCVIRFKPLDFGGRVLLMNYFLEEADTGAMLWLNVSGGPAADMTDAMPRYCTCKATPGCYPVDQCGTSNAGRDQCGVACMATPPPCPGGLICNVDSKRCEQPFPYRTSMSLPIAPHGQENQCKIFPVSPMPDASITTNVAGWFPYDFCANLHFCSTGTGYGFTLPGQPCVPHQAPLIRVPFGLIFGVVISNKATVPTNLYVHGLHVAADGNGLDVTRLVYPGECMVFDMDAWAASPGTFWYHAGPFRATASQVSKGAYGMLIMEDDPAFAPNKDVALWMRNELLLLVSKFGVTFRGNGQTPEYLHLVAGEWYRLRVAVVAPEDRALVINFADEQNCEVHAVAYDGTWTSVVPESTQRKSMYDMLPGSRIDVAIRCNKGRFPITLIAGALNGVAAWLDVVPGGISTANPFIFGRTWHTFPRRMPHVQDLSVEQPLATIPIELSSDGISVAQASPVKWNPSLPLKFDLSGGVAAPEDLPANIVIELVITGSDKHPFHIQTWPVQVMSQNCGIHRQGEFYDVISSPNPCTLRFQTIDFSGRMVMRSALLREADAGLMGWANIINGHLIVDYMKEAGACYFGTTCVLPALPVGCLAQTQCGPTQGNDECGLCTTATPEVCPTEMSCSAGHCVPNCVPTQCNPAPNQPADYCGTYSGLDNCGARCSSLQICPVPLKCLNNACVDPITGLHPNPYSPSPSPSPEPTASPGPSDSSQPSGSPSSSPSRSPSPLPSPSRSPSQSPSPRPSPSPQPTPSPQPSPSPSPSPSRSPSPSPKPCVNTCPVLKEKDSCGTQTTNPCTGVPCPCATGLVCKANGQCRTAAKKFAVAEEHSWGYAIGRLNQITSQSTEQLQELVEDMVTTQEMSFADGRHAHIDVASTNAYVVSLPEMTGFRAIISNWGPSEVLKAVVTSFTPSDKMARHLGLPVANAGASYVLLCQMDRLAETGELVNNAPLELALELPYPTTKPPLITLHTPANLRGTDLITAGGTLSPMDGGQLWVAMIPQTSFISVQLEEQTEQNTTGTTPVLVLALILGLGFLFRRRPNGYRPVVPLDDA